jgi:hypothetical protein
MTTTIMIIMIEIRNSYSVMLIKSNEEFLLFPWNVLFNFDTDKQSSKRKGASLRVMVVELH